MALRLPNVVATLLPVVILLLGIVPALRAEGEGHYTIVGSSQIRPNADYHVAVTLHDDAREPAAMRLTLQNGAEWQSVKDIVVQPSSTESLVFEVPAPVGNSPAYKLIAEGLTGIRFRNETDLTLQSKRLSVLMQSDKAMYKPGDLVRFRVLVLDVNMRPITVNGAMQVHVLDGNGNRIRQWTNATAARGIFGGELQLSEYPVLGKWSLNVDVMGVSKRKFFEVAEYVLPKFEVIIETEKNVVFRDEYIRANIRAKYTYGKPVRGEATVTLQPKIYGAYQPLIGDLISRKVLPIQLKGSVEFNIRNDLKLSDEYERDLQMDVIFEEYLTGRKQSAQTIITIRRSQFRITAVNRKALYRDGEPYVLAVEVKRHDGRPFTEAGQTIELAYGSHLESERSDSVSLDKAGRAQISWNLPANRTQFQLTAKFRDVTDGLGYITRFNQADRRIYGLQTNVLTEKPTLGATITIEVESASPLGSYTYQILGRGDILRSETVSVPGSNRHELKFMATFAMVPTVKVIVYQIRNGQMYSSTETITLRDRMQNAITIEASVAKTQPGKEVQLKITTRPNSIVGLLGVDQSVLLLKSGNDFSQSDVFDELDKYAQDANSVNRRKRFTLQGYSQFSVNFKNVGAFLLCNLYEPIPDNRNRIEPIGINEIHNHPNEVLTVRKADIGPAHVFRTNTRPPLAGPYAFSRVPESKWKRQRVLLDTILQNTWLFANGRAGPDGVYTLRKNVPDTITSWMITGFSLDPVTGLALTDAATQLTVFQPFFVSLSLPYSVKRGEVVSIPVVVFNHMDSLVNAEVTLHNEDQDFEFVEISNELDAAPKIELFRRKRVYVKSNDGTATYFMIRPKTVGTLKIKVTATSPLAGDGVERVLPVVPEGVPMFHNQAQFVNLRDTNSLMTNFTISVPKNAVPDSTHIEISLVGDLLGSAIQNVDRLIRLPAGCGEQNMLNFVPNIVVLNYLRATNRLSDEQRSKAIRFMEIGYQRELNYRHADGSFSAFGKSDASGSTWLTAFVARSFRQAAPYIDVEEQIVSQALRWLASVQADNGSFPEVGTVVHAGMQGGAGQGIALTAYALIAFVENQPSVSLYRNVINKAMDYIVRNLETLNDTYTQALAAYALQVAEHNAKDFVLRTLDDKATRQDGQMFWMRPIGDDEKRNPWLRAPNSLQTEIGAYALLAHLRGGQLADAAAIMKWLLRQQNAEGGFASTQDTIVGLQALAAIGERFADGDTDMRVTVTYGQGLSRDIQLNAGNRAVLQQFALPASVRQLNVTARGHGVGLLALASRYNVNVTGAWPRFTVDPHIFRITHPDNLHLSVCTSFVASESEPRSNMAVMEVEFPSGFTADLDTIPSIEAQPLVRQVETRNGDTVMVIYFDHLEPKELCVTVDAYRTHRVAMQRPAPVTVYDYYDTTRKARMFYRMAESTLCDICEADDCADACAARAAKQQAEEPASVVESGASVLGMGAGLLLVMASFVLM